MGRESEILARDEQVISEAMKIRFAPFVMESQEGARLTGVDGEQLIDFTASWAVANTGYRHPRICETIRDQLRDALANSPLSIPQESVIRLAERLREIVPGEQPTKVWFGHSGSEAGDLLAKALPEAGSGETIINFEGSYHGITAGAATISGHSTQESVSGDDVVTLPFPNRSDEVAGETRTETALERVQEVFDTYDVAGVITEPLQSDGGILVPPDAFLTGLADICSENDAYFVMDEVKAGLGRTGSLFACEHADVVPDAIMMGKPLGSGLPISAVVGRPEIVDFKPASHMMTTAASPLPVASAHATLDVIQEESLPKQAAHKGTVLRDRLEEIQSASPIVGDIRGRGLMQGVEITTEEGSDPSGEMASRVVLWAWKQGLGVFYVGMDSNVLEITPPLTISEETLNEGCQRLAQAVENARTRSLDESLLTQFAGW